MNMYNNCANVEMPKTPSKSTPVHDVVAAALSRRHHLNIHVVAGPIQLANDSHSIFAKDVIHHIFLLSPIFWRDERV